VFVVANSGDRPNPAEILFEWESLRRDSPPSREKGERVAGTIAARTKGGGGLGTDFEADGGTVAMFLNGGGMNRIDAESETLVAVAWDEELNAHEDISGPIIRGGDGGRHAGVMAPLAFAQNTCDHIRLMGGDGGIVGAVAFAKNQSGEVRVGETFNTINTNSNASGRNTSLLAYSVANSLNGNSGGMHIEATYVPQRMAVRRLLPEECEALQGFPRGYTNIPGAADGWRYKALGNSMAVPVMAWIGRRIKEAYAND